MGFANSDFRPEYSAICGDGGACVLFPDTSADWSTTTHDARGEAQLADDTLPGDRIGSLGEAFARVPNDLRLPSTVGFRVVVSGKERELRSELRDEVYRIGREAIVNACRHSRATNIETDLEYGAAELRIAVCDNGSGIDAQKLQWGRNEHCGLQGMRERAEKIGARLKVLSCATAGTEVELCVAFEHQSSQRLRGWLARMFLGKTRAGDLAT